MPWQKRRRRGWAAAQTGPCSLQGQSTGRASVRGRQPQHDYSAGGATGAHLPLCRLLRMPNMQASLHRARFCRPSHAGGPQTGAPPTGGLVLEGAISTPLLDECHVALPQGLGGVGNVNVCSRGLRAVGSKCMAAIAWGSSVVRGRCPVASAKQAVSLASAAQGCLSPAPRGG